MKQSLGLTNEAAFYEALLHANNEGQLEVPQTPDSSNVLEIAYTCKKGQWANEAVDGFHPNSAPPAWNASGTPIEDLDLCRKIFVIGAAETMPKTINIPGPKKAIEITVQLPDNAKIAVTDIGFYLENGGEGDITTGRTTAPKHAFRVGPVPYGSALITARAQDTALKEYMGESFHALSPETTDRITLVLEAATETITVAVNNLTASTQYSVHLLPEKLDTFETNRMSEIDSHKCRLASHGMKVIDGNATVTFKAVRKAPYHLLLLEAQGSGRAARMLARKQIPAAETMHITLSPGGYLREEFSALPLVNIVSKEKGETLWFFRKETCLFLQARQY